ncbi:MAG TPA: hypothetical protein IAB31_03345 [Candidatus Choladousia intestinavium]|uniref:Transglutaminase-like domain-containing protein n=1 Tax=Candidatus Choladousia intestinavium TaxID=2840727 RepID=A0A9D1AAI8_9FIRM|nr:hypothetical protein [Candidatus Choladousia intestinavium]
MRVKSNFYYTQLPGSQTRELYYEILRGIQAHRNTARIQTANLTQDEVRQVLYAVEYDYPEFFYVRFFGEGCSTVRYGNGDLEIQFRYRFSSEEQKKKIAENQRFVQYILSHLPETAGQSSFTSALWLHDTLIRNIRYDNRAGEAGSDDSPDAYTILGGASSKTAVCAGISKLYQMLCEYVGIWCIYVSGKSRKDQKEGMESDGGRHAWNMIRIGRQYAYVDVTWDLQEDEREMPLSHAYFGMSDEQCTRRHIVEPRYPGIRFPKCQENNTLNYYIRKKSFIRSVRQLEQYIRKILQEKERKFSFQIDPGSIEHKILRSRIEAWMERYLTQEAKEVSGWSWRCNETMMVFDYVLRYK